MTLPPIQKFSILKR